MQKLIFGLWLVLGVCLGVPSLHAQGTGSGSVRGIVRNENGEPLGNVTVVAKNTTTGLTSGSATDTAGLFRFSKLPSNGHYSFSFSSIGFETQTLSGYEIKESSAITILVKLKTQSGALNEVVVVGYGTQKKANLTGAVAQVSGDVLDRRSIPNLAQGLQGEIPYLTLLPGDGKPVTSAVFDIRGATSIG